MEQVAVEPCEAGGVQIEIRSTFTEPKSEVTTEFVVVVKHPAAHSSDVGEMPVDVPELEVKRYV